MPLPALPIVFWIVAALFAGTALVIAYLNWGSIRSWWESWMNNNLTTRDGEFIRNSIVDKKSKGEYNYISTKDTSWIGILVLDKQSNGKYSYIAAGYNELTKKAKNAQRIEADEIADEFIGKRVIEVR